MSNSLDCRSDGGGSQSLRNITAARQFVFTLLGATVDREDWSLVNSACTSLPRLKTDKRLRPVLALRAGKVHRARSPLLREQVPAAA